MSHDPIAVLLPVAVIAAAGAALAAVSLHGTNIECGYDLSAARARSTELHQRVRAAEQRASRARRPEALMAHAAALGLGYPDGPNVIRRDDILFIRRARIESDISVTALAIEEVE